ncbi:MAG: hypothetical protein ACYTEQ_25600 [Planctomycetota bacterium]
MASNARKQTRKCESCGKTLHPDDPQYRKHQCIECEEREYWAMMDEDNA